MISGTIIGEINRLMIKVFAGIVGRDRPSAANVPKVVDNIVAKKAMMTLFRTAPCQFRFEKKSSYHFNEYPAGSSANISLVKVKNGTELKESGTTTIKGKIKKKKISPHRIRKP